MVKKNIMNNTKTHKKRHTHTQKKTTGFPEMCCVFSVDIFPPPKKKNKDATLDLDLDSVAQGVNCFPRPVSKLGMGPKAIGCRKIQGKMNLSI